tara:strand:- start:590 stop:892 length:303 start_codon:yes stop_codon:yes gene_type:complete
MNLKEQFEKETELNLISEYSEFKDEWSGDYSNDYVEWLEAKINYTRCCTELSGKKAPTFEEFINQFNLQMDEDGEYFFDDEYFNGMGLYYKYAEHYGINP